MSALLEGKLSNHHGDFFCLICFNSYAKKNRLEEHEEICNNHDMPKFSRRIIKHPHGVKWLKVPFAIYLDLESLLKKKNNIVKTISKNHTQRKKRHMNLLAGQCLQNDHLTKQKINSIITEEGIVLKNCVKILKSMQWK